LAAGLRLDPLGELKCSPDPLAAIRGATYKGGMREGRGKAGEGEGKERVMEGDERGLETPNMSCLHARRPCVL